MAAKNGTLSMFRPGNGIGWILSIGASSLEGRTVRSTSRVRPLSAAYSGVRSWSRPISSSTASSISMNSIGTRRIVSSDSVTTAAASRLIASTGSSEGE